MANSNQVLEDEIDVRKYLEVVWRRRNLILAVATAATIFAAIVSLSTPRSWEASTIVMVPEPPKAENTQAQVVGGIQVTSPSVVYSQGTYARLIRSTVLADAVVRKLNLSVRAEELSSWVRAKSIRDTRLIEITVKGSGPEAVEAIADGFAEALVEYDRQVISAELTQARKFVETQLAKARQDLEAKERLLTEFNQRENLAALESEVSRRLSDLSARRQAYEQNRIDLGVASRRLEQLNRELTATSALRLSGTTTQANTLGASLPSNLWARLADLESQRAALLERYTPSHPSVLVIDAEIAQTRQELAGVTGREPQSEERRANVVREQLESQKASLEIEVAGLDARDKLLARAIAAQEAAFRSLSGRLAEKRTQLSRLVREVDIAKSTYTTISNKVTETVVAEGMKGGFVRVVDRATVRSAAGGTVVKVSLAGVLGLLVGTMVSFVMEFFTTPLVAAPARPEAGTAPERRKLGALGD